MPITPRLPAAKTVTPAGVPKSSLNAESAAAASTRQKLTEALRQFIHMYRPHAAREDTVLFPAFRRLVPGTEYDSLGEEFEAKEHQLFGEDGFEAVVNKVAGIEKQLGIYDLTQFTPKA